MEVAEFIENRLMEAYKIHNEKHRVPVTWRVVIRCPFDGTGEVGDDRQVQGIPLSDWLRFKFPTEPAERARQTYQQLKIYLKGQKIRGVSWSATDLVDPEIFLSAGFCWAMSAALNTRSEAEALRETWASMGLDCFTLIDIGGADIYGTADQGPEMIEAFREMELAGLGCQVQGYNQGRAWKGIALTQKGVDAAEDLTERKRRELVDATKPEKPFISNIKCLQCGAICYRTTDAFEVGKLLKGSMLELLLEFQNQSWLKPFPDDAEGEAIICAECGASLAGPNHRLPENCLVDEPPSTGRIDDEKLMELVDQGLTQVQIAEVFSVRKQAVSKRLKKLKGLKSEADSGSNSASDVKAG